jgi:integrase
VIRPKGHGWVVEIYDPGTKRKRHVKPGDYGMEVPTTERQAKAVERAALNARDENRRHGATDELCETFSARWTTDFPRKGAATNLHNAERATIVAVKFRGRTVRSISRIEARALGKSNPARVPALRAMWTDAVQEGLADTNVFAKLGLDRGRGREDIIVLTTAEVDRLVEISLEVHGEKFGGEFGAMITWSAYTCMRPGETFAARFSRLVDDVYDVSTQFNSKARRETAPKHGGDGLIYVPQPAIDAVLGKPRRLEDDLMFRTKQGKQFRQTSLHEAWKEVRSVFTAGLPEDHHLRRRLAADSDDKLDFYELRHFGATYMLNELGIEPWVIAEQLRHSDGGTLVLKLYGHPDRRKAIDRIRRAYGDSVRPLRLVSRDSLGTSAGKGA